MTKEATRSTVPCQNITSRFFCLRRASAPGYIHTRDTLRGYCGGCRISGDEESCSVRCRGKGFYAKESLSFRICICQAPALLYQMGVRTGRAKNTKGNTGDAFFPRNGGCNFQFGFRSMRVGREQLSPENAALQGMCQSIRRLRHPCSRSRLSLNGGGYRQPYRQLPGDHPQRYAADAGFRVRTYWQIKSVFLVSGLIRFDIFCLHCRAG